MGNSIQYLEEILLDNLGTPKIRQGYPDRKTDKKYFIWIADLHKHGLVPGSFIPTEEIRELRDLMRYRQKTDILQIHRKKQSSKSKLKATVISLAKLFRKEVELVATTPSIKDFSAIAIISEIDVDMSVFPTAKHLCSWAYPSKQRECW